MPNAVSAKGTVILQLFEPPKLPLLHGIFPHRINARHNEKAVFVHSRVNHHALPHDKALG